MTTNHNNSFIENNSNSWGNYLKLLVFWCIAELHSVIENEWFGK